MGSVLRASVVSTLGLLIVTGLCYPLAVTGICQLCLAAAADGSLLLRPDGSVLGSRLIGQPFTQPRFFWGRPSSAGTGYDPQASSPSNLAPTSEKLAEGFAAEASRAHADGVVGPIPADRLTGSGSGLDPDISVANALGQVSRVARARGLPEQRVAELIAPQAERGFASGFFGGFFAEPGVNVLELNLALDQLRP